MFDQEAEIHGVQKIKTIGDCYMTAAGLMPNCGFDHAEQVIDFAVSMLHSTLFSVFVNSIAYSI